MKSRKKLVVFVHGLGGAKKTWNKFISVIEADESHSELFDYKIFTYATSAFRVFPLCLLRKTSALHDIANALKTFVEMQSSYEEIILVGHSFGGIVVKKYLINLIHSGVLDSNVKKAIFYAVPHNGAGLANFSYLSSLATTLGLCNIEQLYQLKKESSVLDDLNDQWFEVKPDEHFHITCVVALRDMVVSSASAKAGCRYNLTTLNDKGHITVKEPEDVEDFSYQVFLKVLLKKKEPKFLNNELIQSINSRAIADAGRRYIVNEDDYIGYNFEVGIENLFDALINPDQFVDNLQNLVWEFGDTLLPGLNKVFPSVNDAKKNHVAYLGQEDSDIIFNVSEYQSVNLDFEDNDRFMELVALIHGKELFSCSGQVNLATSLEQFLQ